MPVKPSQISLFNFDEPEEASSQKEAPVPKPEDQHVAAVNTEAAEPAEPVIIDVPFTKPPEVIFTEPEEEPVDLNAETFPGKKQKPVFNGSGFATGKVKAADAVKSKRGRKSIEEMTASVDLVDVPPDEILFQKRYYAIGKVAEMFKVNQSLIRLWENEFDILKPKKNGKGDRFFRPEDVKNIQLIHHLMREKKYTMEGAKNFIKNNKKTDEVFAMIEALKKIKGFLLELRANL